MKKRSITRGALCALCLSALASVSSAQEKTNAKPATTTTTTATATASSPAAKTAVTITAATTPLELARAALTAQGGEKFRNMKSLVLIGSVDLYGPNSAQALPGKFVVVTAGDRVRIEIQSPAFNFRQIYDGQQGYSSIPQMQLPPPSKFGLNVLNKFEQPGYTVTALPDKKKQRAFRITDAEGNSTDFYVDPATGRVMTFLIPYEGYTFGVENTSLKEVDGVLVPYAFTQRLETPQGAFFAEYKVKTVKINEPLGEDVFSIPDK
ncbi:MAG TPA: hypothetical protein VM911_04435 [Pyrinomonadaceae bacterium]|nr:hypothetical protein [Pyrinomonadaceae bacterium]